MVALTGGPRKSGNSNCMAYSFVAVAQNNGFDVTRFDTAFMHIRVCHACNQCFSKEKACIFDDNFNKIVQNLLDADLIVIVFPVYWYIFPEQLKAAIDKMYSFFVAGKDFSGKQCVLIACREEKTTDTFTGVKFAYEKIIELMNCQSIVKF
ncbi:flavodoxin family protein [Clostridium botulinum]|uniref:flavodoxin family protein n=1 Tax=Clostridium botulinum TaxID=1491 RepID=UPI003A8007EE